MISSCSNSLPIFSTIGGVQCVVGMLLIPVPNATCLSRQIGKIPLATGTLTSAPHRGRVGLDAASLTEASHDVPCLKSDIEQRKLLFLISTVIRPTGYMQFACQSQNRSELSAESTWEMTITDYIETSCVFLECSGRVRFGDFSSLIQ